MDDRSLARGIAAGRLGFGLILLVAPRVLVRRSGNRQDPPPPYVWWLRAFGTRDAVLGAGTLAALAGDDDVAAARWVQVGAVADTLDVATVVLHGDELDRLGRWATLAVAVPATIAGWKAGRGLATPG